MSNAAKKRDIKDKESLPKKPDLKVLNSVEDKLISDSLKYTPKAKNSPSLKLVDDKFSSVKAVKKLSGYFFWSLLGASCLLTLALLSYFYLSTESSSEWSEVPEIKNTFRPITTEKKTNKATQKSYKRQASTKKSIKAKKVTESASHEVKSQQKQVGTVRKMEGLKLHIGDSVVPAEESERFDFEEGAPDPEELDEVDFQEGDDPSGSVVEDEFDRVPAEVEEDIEEFYNDEFDEDLVDSDGYEEAYEE